MGEDKARAIGINHVALMVADIDAALDFYGQLFEFELRGRDARSAFIDLGDQFIALFTGDDDAPDQGRHFGLVVDDPGKVRRKLAGMGVEVMDGPGVDFHDPWGNYWQMVTYEKVQFMKMPAVMRAMGIAHWRKTEAAEREIAERGFAEDWAR
jgi:catechol 2,3-dioxygenase-like lactoylglutathione lyase family enzyme